MQKSAWTRDFSTAPRRHSAPAPPVGVVLSAPGSTSHPDRFRLQSGRCVIGAGSKVDWIVSAPTVSRRHVEVEIVPQGVLLTDLGSRNGTFYLGQQIKQLIVSPGSVISLGDCDIKIDVDPLTYKSSASGEFERYPDLIGRSRPMLELFQLLHRLEGTLVDVLIEGESGTGKEVIARSVHSHSQVSTGPFIPVNCGALHRELVQSELFGHRKGAFTGAGEHRAGAFEAANGGTLFLDEIGELSREAQPLLLRVLQERAVTRLGETNPRPFQVRVIAATNRDLKEEVQSGNFREDLYYRLNVVSVKVPPLRDRGGDIGMLAKHLARQFGANELPQTIVEELKNRTWPGNVRQLAHAVQSFVAIGVIPPPDSSGPRPHLSTHLSHDIDVNQPYEAQKTEFLKQFQKAYLSALLAETGGNISDASRRSGIERSYLGKLAKKVLEDDAG